MLLYLDTHLPSTFLVFVLSPKKLSVALKKTCWQQVLWVGSYATCAEVGL